MAVPILSSLILSQVITGPADPVTIDRIHATVIKHEMLRRIPASLSASGSRCLRLSPAATRIPLRPRASVANTRQLSPTAARNMSSQSKVSPPLTTTLPSDSFHLVAESEKPGAPEDALYEQQIKDVEAWWATDRYAGIKRPYTAADVVSKRGSLQQSYPASLMARKLWALIQEKLSKGEPLHTSTPSWSWPSDSKSWCSSDTDHTLASHQWAP